MWVFKTLRVGDKLRNPIQGEFFATSAIEGPAQALVRESIQNSMDASSGAPVRVVITVATRALPPTDAIDRLFRGAWEHFKADGNGLMDPKPEPGTPCPYLVVEDFNTLGLTGDPSQTNPRPEDKNNFFNFFRAEGVSGKTGSELGRWGVGKFVFPRSSRASTHFGITVRETDRRRLMLGAITLKGHSVGAQDGLFTPDGLYGTLREDGLVLPIEDSAKIDEVAALFNVQRQHDPGTSIIVPFIDPDDFTFEALINAAVRSYFAPLLSGELEITLRHDDREAILRSDNLISVLEAYPALTDLLPLVRLAQTASSARDEDRIVLRMPDPSKAAKWCDELLAPEALQAIRAKLTTNEPVAIRVPVTVRKKGCSDRSSYFDIYLQADRNCNDRPVFVREGIIVSDVRGRRIREIRSLVEVKDPPLAEMLGNSENPAHTQWQKDGSKFKGYYTYGAAVIDFVTDSVGKLLAILNQASQQADPSLTVDFFSVEAVDETDETETGNVHQKRQKSGPDSTEPKPEIEPRPTRIRIQRNTGGFAVTAGTSPPPLPFMLEVRCAYETRTGNPIKKWDPADFVLGKDGVDVNLVGGIKIITEHNNRLMLSVTGHDFRVSVDGFDTSRDLYVRADVREVANASSEA
jgi:hypothetical protein